MRRHQPEEAALPAADRTDPGATPSDSTEASVSPDGVTAWPGLPDLLALSLEEIRTLDHPVLADLLVELRERAGRPAETLWGFSQGAGEGPRPRPDSSTA